MIAQPYEIRIRGSLSPAVLAVFAPWTATTEAAGTVTVIRGTITDQAELGGLLQTIDALGLVLLEVRPQQPGGPP